MTTIVQTDNLDLINFGKKQQDDLLSELMTRQNQQQEPESQEEKDLKEKYDKLLVFKTHGEGGFGSVTEYYDLYRRVRFAKKQFKEIQHLKQELDSNDRIEAIFTKEELQDLMAGISRTDFQNNILYYESGIITLDEFVNKRREKQVYWFDNEDQLGYIISRLFDLIMMLYNKNVYHSDLKLVNTIITNDMQQNYVKLIDMGGTTFDYNYLIAITLQYFPPQDTFVSTESKESRILAELYQFGRIIQEICLSSIYSKQSLLYEFLEEHQTYKSFKSKYFQNNEECINSSLELIKLYYSPAIYELVKTTLGLKSDVESIKKQIKALKKTEFLEDNENYVQKCLKDKTENYFSKYFSQNENPSIEDLKFEFQFYLDFELESQGSFKAQQLLLGKLGELSRGQYAVRDGKHYDQSLLLVYHYLFHSRESAPKKVDNIPIDFLFTQINQTARDVNSNHQNGLREALKTIVNHKDVDRSLKLFLFQQSLLLGIKNYFDYSTNLGSTKADHKGREEDMLKVFGYDKNPSELEQLLIKLLPFYHCQKNILPSQFNELRKLNEEILKFAEKTADKQEKKLCYDQLLFNWALEQKTIQFNLSIYRHEDTISIDIFPNYYQVNDYAYTQEEYDYLYDLFKNKRRETTKQWDEYVAKISEKAIEIGEKHLCSQKYFQYFLNVKEEALSSASLKYNTKTQEQEVIDKQKLQQCYELGKKALKSFDLYPGIYSVCQKTYEDLHKSAYYTGRKEEARNLYFRALQNQYYIQYRWDAVNLEGKALYQEIQAINKMVKTHHACHDMDLRLNSKYSEIMYKSIVPQKYKEEFDYKTYKYIDKPIVYEQQVSELAYRWGAGLASDTRSYKKYALERAASCKTDSEKKKKDIQERDIEDEFFKMVQQLFEKANTKYEDKTFVKIGPNGEDIPYKEKSFPYLFDYSLYLFLLREGISVNPILGDQFARPSMKSLVKSVEQIQNHFKNTDKSIVNEIYLEKVLYCLIGQYQGENIDNSITEEIASYLSKDQPALNTIQNHKYSILKAIYKKVNDSNQNSEKEKQAALEKENEQKKKQQEAEAEKQRQKEEKEAQKKKEKEEKEAQKQKEKEEKEAQKKKEQQQKQQQQQQQKQQPQQQQQQPQKKKQQTQPKQNSQQPKYNKKPQQQQKQEQKREETACCTMF